MLFVKNWTRPFWRIPKHVHFVAVVFIFAILFVAQEAGQAFAQTPGPSSNMGANMGTNMPMNQPMNQPSGTQYGNMGPNMGGNFQQPQQTQGQYQGMMPQQNYPSGNTPSNMPGNQQGGMQYGNMGQGMGQPSMGSNQGQQGGQGQMGDQNMNQGMGSNMGGNQGQMGGQGQGMGQGNGNQQGGQQNDQMDQQRQKQMAQQLTQIQKGVKSMPIKKLQAKLATLEKQGISVSAETKSKIETVAKTVETVLAATSMEDEATQAALSDLSELGPEVGDIFNQLEQLSQMPKILKQAEKEIKKIDTLFAKVKKTAARSKVDVSGIMTQFEQAVNEVKNSFVSAKQAMANGDAENGMQILQEEVFNKMGDVYQYEGVIQALQNVRSQLTQLDRFTKNAQRIITKLQKSGQDVTEASTMLEELKAQLVSLKQMLGTAVDPDELRGAVSEIFDLQQGIDDLLNMNTVGPQMQMMQPQNSAGGYNFNIQIPSNMMPGGGAQGNMNQGQGMGQGQNQMGNQGQMNQGMGQ